MLQCLQQELRLLVNPAHAANLQRFFKTGPGEYGEGDKFLGLTVRQLRALAKRYRGLPLHDIAALLRSPIHEERLLALLLLVQAYRDGDTDKQRRIYKLYLRCTKFINNWDLVDCSAEHIVGAFLSCSHAALPACEGDAARPRQHGDRAPRLGAVQTFGQRIKIVGREACRFGFAPHLRSHARNGGIAAHDSGVSSDSAPRNDTRHQQNQCVAQNFQLHPPRLQQLARLARSKSLWERRIAIMATFHCIKRSEFTPTLAIARLLLHDEHDLIHKAVGWMLREVGKRDLPAEEAFLRRHYRQMPRTMLRYAIERLPESRRQRYLKGTIPVCGGLRSCQRQ
jgi:3-methyladenine DNA glycosylase AlkD